MASCPNNCTAHAVRLVHPLKGRRWGTGQKRCPARARRTNVPPFLGFDTVTFHVHLDPNDVKRMKVDPSSTFVMLRMRVQKVEKVVLNSVHMSPLYSFVKVLYSGQGIEPLCTLAGKGSHGTGTSKGTWLWPLGRAHQGQNSEIQAFSAVFLGVITTPACPNHGSPSWCSGCIPMRPCDFNQVYLSSLDLEGGEWLIVCQV